MSKLKKPVKAKLKNHFYLSTDVGMVHVNMNPNASPEIFEAINHMVKLAHEKL